MSTAHATARLEAFCDAVFAIAMTLLVIDVRIASIDSISSTAEFWGALQHEVPSMAAYVLSFVVILITWVNHHALMKLVHKTSAPFIYANGFLLLTVVSIPFPTSLLGATIWTDHATPAVVLYNGTLTLQAVGWILMTSMAMRNQLARDDKATAALRELRRNGYFAFALYALLGVAACWFPQIVAAITTLTWVFWLFLGVKLRHE